MTGAQTQLLVHALGSMAQLAVAHHAQRNERALEELRHGSFAHMVDAMVTRRVEVVQRGFVEILGSYIEQARACIEEKKRYAAAELAENDMMRRIEQRSRLKEIDRELATIRTDMQLLFGAMSEVILALGGTVAEFERQLPQMLTIAGGADVRSA